MSQERKDTGFSASSDREGARLLNKDGSSNIKKNGLRFFERFSLYHSLIHMPTWKFLITIFGVYIICNCVFAAFYIFAGIENLVDATLINIESPFLKAFFFSSQTITTLGYGQLSPTGFVTNMIASFESFLGLLLFALLTGLLYGRFSRPKSKLIFSDTAVVSPYLDGEKGLMIRLANPKNSNLINCKAVMVFSHIDSSRNGNMRKYFTLSLEIDTISMMASSWTVVHPLMEDSPLIGFTHDEMLKQKAELIVQVEGYDETYLQQVSQRTSYTASEIIVGAKFKKILNFTDEGACIDLGALSDYEVV